MVSLLGASSCFRLCVMEGLAHLFIVDYMDSFLNFKISSLVTVLIMFISPSTEFF